MRERHTHRHEDTRRNTHTHTRAQAHPIVVLIRRGIPGGGIHRHSLRPRSALGLLLTVFPST